MADENRGAWTWGVDVSTKRVAIACVRGLVGRVEAVEHAGDPFRRLLVQQRVVVGLTRTLATEHPPVYVLVEQPGGRTVEPQLWYSVGATIAALLEAFELVGVDPAFDTVPVATWKMEAGIGGGADKPKIAGFARAAYGWDGGQDEADALGIATCAWGRFVAQVNQPA